VRTGFVSGHGRYKKVDSGTSVKVPIMRDVRESEKKALSPRRLILTCVIGVNKDAIF
jgi:hypothetical protein